LGVVSGSVLTLYCVMYPFHPILCPVPSSVIWNDEFVLEWLKRVAFEFCTISHVAVLAVVFCQRSEGVGIVWYIVRLVYVLSGSPLVCDPILLLYLLSDLLLCAEALFVSLCSLLWGKPELCGG